MESGGETTNGQCHCGGVRFRVRLSDGLTKPRRCDCSYCRMSGAVVVSAELDDIAVTEGGDLLTEYRFNTGTARHFFCSRCGIYTHHQRRSNPDQYGINAACLVGVSPFDFREVPVYDGVHHPADGGSASGLAGTLFYVPVGESTGTGRSATSASARSGASGSTTRLHECEEVEESFEARKTI